ncbi:hypothetical protein FRB97_001898, partial [Tulasnella sp. 331]
MQRDNSGTSPGSFQSNPPSYHPTGSQPLQARPSQSRHQPPYNPNAPQPDSSSLTYSSSTRHRPQNSRENQLLDRIAELEAQNKQLIQQIRDKDEKLEEIQRLAEAIQTASRSMVGRDASLSRAHRGESVLPTAVVPSSEANRQHRAAMGSQNTGETYPGGFIPTLTQQVDPRESWEEPTSFSGQLTVHKTRGMPSSPMFEVPSNAGPNPAAGSSQVQSDYYIESRNRGQAAPQIGQVPPSLPPTNTTRGHPSHQNYGAPASPMGQVPPPPPPPTTARDHPSHQDYGQASQTTTLVPPQPPPQGRGSGSNHSHRSHRDPNQAPNSPPKSPRQQGGNYNSREGRRDATPQITGVIDLEPYPASVLFPSPGPTTYLNSADASRPSHKQRESFSIKKGVTRGEPQQPMDVVKRPRTPPTGGW